MSIFFRGITETVRSLFRGIFSERNSVPVTGKQRNILQGSGKQEKSHVGKNHKGGGDQAFQLLLQVFSHEIVNDAQAWEFLLHVSSTKVSHLGRWLGDKSKKSIIFNFEANIQHFYFTRVQRSSVMVQRSWRICSKDICVALGHLFNSRG